MDALAAKVGDESYNDQLNAKVPQLTPVVNQGVDLAEADGLSIGSNQCRQYYLNKYLIACDGLGVYASGFGKQMDASGSFPGNYAQSIDDKIRAFSEITRAQETGQLTHLVNAESLGTSLVSTSGYPSLMGSGSMQTRIIIGSTGTRIVSVPSGAVGLGLTGFEIGLLVIAATCIIGAIVWSLAEQNIAATAATNQKICEAAMSSGNQTLAQQCIDLAKESTNLGVLGNVLGKTGADLVSSYGKYLFFAGAAALAVYFSPQILGRALKTQDVYQSHKAARAAANRRRCR